MEQIKNNVSKKSVTFGNTLHKSTRRNCIDYIDKLPYDKFRSIIIKSANILATNTKDPNLQGYLKKEKFSNDNGTNKSQKSLLFK